MARILNAHQRAFTIQPKLQRQVFQAVVVPPLCVATAKANQVLSHRDNEGSAISNEGGGCARPALQQQQFGVYGAGERGSLLDPPGKSISAPKQQSPQRPSHVLSNLTWVKSENGYKSKGEKVIKSSRQTWWHVDNVLVLESGWHQPQDDI